MRGSKWNVKELTDSIELGGVLNTDERRKAYNKNIELLVLLVQLWILLTLRQNVAHRVLAFTASCPQKGKARTKKL